MAESSLIDLQTLVYTLAEAAVRTESQLQTLAAAQARTEARLDTLALRVEELATAQARTEARLEELATAQARTEVRLEELAIAQARTEVRLEELATAQARTEVRLEELATAQARTEARLEELATVQARTEARLDARLDTLARHMDDLAQAQRRTDEDVARLRRTIDIKLGGLGARWGIQTEEAFRQGIASILGEVGFQAERYLAYDTTGEVFGKPDQVELDVVVRNGKVMVIEIKASLDRGHVHHFARKVDFYQRQTGREVARRVIITPFVESRARDLADSLGVEIYTDVEDVH